MKILFYRSDWTANATRQLDDEYGGVGYYRIVKMAEQAKKAGHQVTVVGAKFTKKGETLEERYTRIFEKYDVLWTCYTSHAFDASAMYYFRDKFKKKVVLDCDDNYLDVAESHPLYDKLKSSKRDRAFIGTILSFADVITTSTEPLKDRLHEHFKTVYGMEKEIVVLPNFNDLDDWDFKLKKHPGKLVIGYAGSNSHQDDLRMVMPSIHEVMKKHSNVYLEVVGSIDKQSLNIFEDFDQEVMNRCDLWPGTWTFKEYPKFIASRGWDIGIAPLVDTAFTRCKSHIKFMEYSALKIPVIASRVYPYYVDLWGRNIIEHDKTGLLVKPNEWVLALEELVTHPEKRKFLGENAHKHIKENWQYDDSHLEGAINKLLG